MKITKTVRKEIMEIDIDGKFSYIRYAPNVWLGEHDTSDSDSLFLVNDYRLIRKLEAMYAESLVK